MGKRIVVTGASGFIGRNLCKGLDNAGYEVIKMSRTITSVGEIDRVYHLACPSTTKDIKADPTGIMDIIFDGTRDALDIYPPALFINASSKGIFDLDNTPQGCYNIAKRAMETYLEFCGQEYKNYRIPSVYGPDMHDDMFIKRCVDGNATEPLQPDRTHYIAHIDEVVEALIELRDIETEEITLGNIYEHFTTGRRGLYR
ncbi:NAD(P)-dependent oxidoreductase [Planktomarina sp.]|jgi:nucleoside-diphosphate-sugar epimerase|nr:NAD(P)-dependent oxidoreductase [Planktomarina sp.]